MGNERLETRGLPQMQPDIFLFTLLLSIVELDLDLAWHWRTPTFDNV